MARSGLDLPEWMQFGRARIPEQPVPRVRPYSHHAGEAGFKIAKLDRTKQPREVAAERPHDGAVAWVRLYRHHEKNRSARQRRRYRLRDRSGFNSSLGSGHRDRNSTTPTPCEGVPQISSIA